jgi:hypothetical protein
MDFSRSVREIGLDGSEIIKIFFSSVAKCPIDTTLLYLLDWTNLRLDLKIWTRVDFNFRRNLRFGAPESPLISPASCDRSCGRFASLASPYGLKINRRNLRFGASNFSWAVGPQKNWCMLNIGRYLGILVNSPIFQDNSQCSPLDFQDISQYYFASLWSCSIDKCYSSWVNSYSICQCYSCIQNLMG